MFTLPGTASTLPPSSGTYQLWITSVDSTSSCTGGVHGDDQPVVGEGVVRVVVAPQPLLPGGGDDQRVGPGRVGAAAGELEAVRAGRGDLAGPLSEDDAGQEQEQRQGGEAESDAALDARAASNLPRLGAALGAKAPDGVDQGGVDRHNDDHHHNQADPVERRRILCPRGVRGLGRDHARARRRGDAGERRQRRSGCEDETSAQAAFARRRQGAAILIACSPPARC